MRSLLLVTSLVAFIFLKACGNGVSKKDDIKNDSLSSQPTDQKSQLDATTDSSTHSDVQYSDPHLPNTNNTGKSDTTKLIHNHQAPNQHELDSIKAAKTKNKK